MKKLVLLILALTISGASFAEDNWNKAVPAEVMAECRTKSLDMIVHVYHSFQYPRSFIEPYFPPEWVDHIYALPDVETLDDVSPLANRLHNEVLGSCIMEYLL